MTFIKPFWRRAGDVAILIHCELCFISCNLKSSWLGRVNISIIPLGDILKHGHKLRMKHLVIEVSAMQVGGLMLMLVIVEVEAEEGTEDGMESSGHEESDTAEPNDEPHYNGVLEDKSGGDQSKNNSIEKDEEMEEEKADSGEPSLFKLAVVNSYGSQEVQKLEPSQTYKLTSE